MTKVYPVTCWTDSAHLRGELNRLSKGDYTWNDIVIVTNPAECDFFVVLNHPNGQQIDKKRTVVFQMEPDSTRRKWGEWYKPNKSDFLYVYDTEHHKNNIEWHISHDYNTLMTSSPTKTKTLSAIVSALNTLPGHKLRLEFVKYLDHLPYFDHYGKGESTGRGRCFRGSLKKKDDGLFPYKYTFNSENECERNYFTEKVVDAILSECLLFYWGCPNLEEWINPMAFIRLDLTRPRDAMRTVVDAINRDEWSRRIGIIREEKKRILNEIQFFPVLERILNGQTADLSHFGKYRP